LRSKPNRKGSSSPSIATRTMRAWMTGSEATPEAPCHEHSATALSALVTRQRRQHCASFAVNLEPLEEEKAHPKPAQRMQEWPEVRYIQLNRADRPGRRQLEAQATCSMPLAATASLQNLRDPTSQSRAPAKSEHLLVGRWSLFNTLTQTERQGRRRMKRRHRCG
jgi:hypothetical protein